MPEQNKNRYGLVACGGNSSRMGTDKSMLQYYEKPQRYHVYDMLFPFCEQVFISCNEAHAPAIEIGYPYIQDDPAFSNTGPMAALLTAFSKFPQKNILFIGCDYPFLTTTELQRFLDGCSNKLSAFYNREADVYDPLLAWYPASSSEQLKKMHETKQFSLQHFLKDHQAVKYFPQDKKSITSIDTYDDFIKTRDLIKKSSH